MKNNFVTILKKKPSLSLFLFAFGLGASVLIANEFYNFIVTHLNQLAYIIETFMEYVLIGLKSLRNPFARITLLAAALFTSIFARIMITNKIMTLKDDLFYLFPVLYMLLISALFLSVFTISATSSDSIFYNEFTFLLLLLVFLTLVYTGFKIMFNVGSSKKKESKFINL